MYVRFSRALLAALAVFAAIASAPRTAQAITCPPVNTPCETITYIIDCTGGPLQERGAPHAAHGKGRVAAPALPIGNCFCEVNDIIDKPAGTACTDDGNACTSDICNGTGACTHPAATGAACTSDGNPCTSDVCDGTGACTHNNPTGGSVCGASCIAPGTCCNNPNSCTGGRVCSGLGGSCGCPTGTFDCGGTCIANTTCCNAPNTCTGGKTCSGIGGSCSCPTGTYDCGGTCVANATCCNNPNNCPAPPNGSASCTAPGGTCSVTCNGGYKTCSGQCIPNAQCCVDADCPSDAPDHRHGICGGGGVCSYACDGGYKPCGATCIPNASCCQSTECTSPPNGCYKTQGTCASGACSYSYNDGASCNADSDACTPNDKCASGACVADTANRVHCVQRDCHTAPMCNKSTGNCDDTAVSNGTACGGNGCASASGTCTGGNCSVPPKDCSSFDTDCKVGLCDASGPVGTPCATTNKLNGTTCALADKCVLTPACNGGDCVGTPKTCDPSAACRVAMCNSTTGDCEESVAPVGTACTITAGCVQNAQCDATGNCVGDTVPDGTPCSKDGCSAFAACSTGSCVCIDSPDFGGALAPIVPTDAADMSTDGGGSSKGCSIGGRAPASPWSPGSMVLLLVPLLGIVRRRRFARAR